MELVEVILASEARKLAWIDAVEKLDTWADAQLAEWAEQVFAHVDEGEIAMNTGVTGAAPGALTRPFGIALYARNMVYTFGQGLIDHTALDDEARALQPDDFFIDRIIAGVEYRIAGGMGAAVAFILKKAGFFSEVS